MKSHRTTTGSLAGLVILASVILAAPGPVPAQAPFGRPSVAQTPQSQRNALDTVRAQVGFLQNATRTALNFRTGAPEKLFQQFQQVRFSFNVLKASLSPQQWAAGANDLAELDAGLDIMEEAFVYYQNDVAAGRSDRFALRNLCDVLRRSSAVWLQQLNTVSRSLQVGRW